MSLRPRHLPKDYRRRDKEFTKLDCFIENESCSGELKTRNIKFFLRYLKENNEIIKEAFNQTTTLLPKKVNGLTAMDMLSRLGSQKEAIINHLTNSTPTIESLSELLSQLDTTLEAFSENIIDPNNKQQCLFYTERIESYKKLINRDDEKVWAEFIPFILTDAFRHCIMMVEQNKPCELLYPYRDSNSGVTNTRENNSRESNKVVDAALEPVLKQIKSQSADETCETTYNNLTELTTEMKIFLRHAAKIFNFMIDTFFDETQTRDLRINPENDEDLKFLADFLFTCDLPCEIDTNGKITYNLKRGDNMSEEDYDLKKHRGKLFLYIIKLVRLLQQLLLSGLNPFNRLILNLGEMHQVKNMFTISFKDFKYFYDQKKKKNNFCGAN